MAVAARSRNCSWNVPGTKWDLGRKMAPTATRRIKRSRKKSSHMFGSLWRPPPSLCCRGPFAELFLERSRNKMGSWAKNGPYGHQTHQTKQEKKFSHVWLTLPPPSLPVLPWPACGIVPGTFQEQNGILGKNWALWPPYASNEAEKKVITCLAHTAPPLAS